MDFSAFDKSKMEEYAARAKASWGDTAEYREYEEKAKGRTPEEQKSLNIQLMAIFSEFGGLKETDPASSQAQALVEKLQSFLTQHYYTCSKEILSELGRMYAAGGDFTTNIDNAAGTGTAAFVDRAIQVYCG